MNRLFSFGDFKLKLAPEVSVRENLSISITVPDFHELMERILSHYGLICRSVQEDRYELRFPGSTITTVGCRSDREAYRALQSNLRVSWKGEAGIELYGYEEFWGSKHEQNVYRQLLHDRIAIFHRYIRHESRLTPAHT